MKTSAKRTKTYYKNIEIKQDNVLILLRNFWKFSKFYGEYLANLHSKNKSAFNSKASRKSK